MQGVLVDLHGKPITSPDQKKRAEDDLKNFMEKHKSRFQDWFTAYGPMSRPPIYYDLSKQEWFWTGD